MFGPSRAMISAPATIRLRIDSATAACGTACCRRCSSEDRGGGVGGPDRRDHRPPTAILLAPTAISGGPQASKYSTTLECRLGAELAGHLGYEKGEPTPSKRSNARNGATSKTIATFEPPPLPERPSTPGCRYRRLPPRL